MCYLGFILFFIIEYICNHKIYNFLTKSTNVNNYNLVAILIRCFAFTGEEMDAPTGGTVASQQRVNRRKTDLMPTIPSPRDLTPTSSSRPSSVYLQGNRPFSRSPGRAYSMSRLDQLSQPRRRPAAELAALHEKSPTLRSSPTAAKSMSRSMTHLAGSRVTQRGSQLHRSDATRSMSQLSGSGQGQSAPVPRMTRAERLRQRAREIAARSTGQLQGKYHCVCTSRMVQFFLSPYVKILFVTRKIIEGSFF